MSGLRERNKERRRQGILDAALELLRVNDIGSVTIEQIAARAEVSPPTVYNLVGTREQLLVALVDRVMEGLVESLSESGEQAEADPVGAALRAGEDFAAAFIAESGAYRQIVRALGDLAVAGSQMTFDPTQIHILAMQRAQALGILRADFDPVALGRQSYLTYVAALFAWGAGAVSDRGFRIAARHGLLTVVAAAAADAHRDRYVAELVELSGKLARVTWNRR